jgi:hypothetical protein
MNKERNREEQLERLFKAAGPVPTLTPDPLLPMHVRALAASDVHRASPAVARPRWAWLSLAGAAFALSMIVGGYIGYGAWSSTEVESTDDAEVLVTAWLQSGFAEDLDQSDASGNEVTE